MKNLNNLRKKLTRKKSNGHYALADYKNDFTSFFDTDSVLLKNLNELSQENLNQFKLSNQPWSGDYWATYRGGIGVRYASAETPMSGEFSSNYNLFKEYWPLDLDSEELLRVLSPAEKYDLLVGDSDFTLTKSVWEEGYR